MYIVEVKCNGMKLSFKYDTGTGEMLISKKEMNSPKLEPSIEQSLVNTLMAMRPRETNNPSPYDSYHSRGKKHSRGKIRWENFQKI